MNYLENEARRIRLSVEAHSGNSSNKSDDDLLFLVYALLARVKGAHTSLADVHDAWSVWMSTIDPSHPSLVPFAELSAETQAEDEPYLRAILQSQAESARQLPISLGN